MKFETPCTSHHIVLWRSTGSLISFLILTSSLSFKIPIFFKFLSLGISLFTPPEELPELPAPDEQRLREAAAALQQRLVLRHWLARHGLQGYLARLLAVGVARLEDVYWLEDNKAKQVCYHPKIK